MARRKQLTMPFSKSSKSIAQVLVKEGFLSKVETSEVDGKKILIAHLRYENRKPVFHDVRLISKPSLRVYVGRDEIAADKDRTLTAVVSTSGGIMTGKEAIKKGMGGELLFKIW